MSGEEKDTKNSNCIICYGRISVTSKTCVHIFHDKAVTDNDQSIVKFLSSILNTPIDKENTCSSVLCRKCMKLLNELEELEAKVEKNKLIINNLFKNTAKISKAFVKKENPLEHNNVETNVKTDDIESKISVNHIQTNSNKVKPEPEVLNKEENVIATEINITKEVKVDCTREVKVILKKLEEEESEDSNDGTDNIDTLQDNCAPGDPDSNSQADQAEIENKAVSKDDFSEVIMKDGDKYVCKLCCEETNTSRDAKEIITHLKDTHDVRLYICDLCGSHFKKRSELSNHLDEHIAKEEGDFQCEVCNRIFSNLRLYRIHKRVHNVTPKSWICETCNKSYGSKNLLDEHTNIHTGKRPYSCQTCGKDFASKYSHRAHVRTHQVRPRPFECSQCNKTFLSQQNLTQHLKTHNGVKEHVCETCGKAFGSAHNLEVHSIVHTGYKPFICRQCGKAFARKAEIRDHERIHTGEKPFQCEFCGATFSQRSNLQSHKRATHYNDKRYKCEQCDKGFKRRRLLDYHIRAVHTGERPFKCDTCSATFVYPEHFKKHMRIHTGEKPYLCEVCGKAFNSRDNRNAHRFIHSDKKPYECLVCGMGFMRKPLLYNHMQTKGHLNDTIIVNQPRLTTDEDGFESRVHLDLVMDENEDSQMIVSELKDHILVQDGDEQKIIRIAHDNEDHLMMEEEENDEDEEEDDDFINFKEEMEDDDDEQVYTYEDEEGNTIVIPPGINIKDIIKHVNKREVRFVELEIPENDENEEILENKANVENEEHKEHEEVENDDDKNDVNEKNNENNKNDENDKTEKDEVNEENEKNQDNKEKMND